jgi:assimilatory nitrate reductase catalytic subunit
MIDSTPRFLQGAFKFAGQGYETATLLDPALEYTVPSDKRAQLIYLRAGNSWDGMIYLVLMQNGAPMRLFPVAGNGATHVPLAVVEDLEPGTKISVFVGAPPSSTGTAVVDIGLIEI